MRTSLFALCAIALLAGCVGGNSDKACQVFSPPPVSAATPTAQNSERVDTLNGNPNSGRPNSGCAQ